MTKILSAYAVAARGCGLKVAADAMAKAAAYIADLEQYIDHLEAARQQENPPS